MTPADHTLAEGAALKFEIEGAALKFEIVNPSDPYTFTAPSLEVAALVIILLGSGRYAAKSLDTPPNEGVPFFMFGGAEEWFRDNCGCTPDESMERTEKSVLADSLDTVTLGSEKRSSMNNIGGRAKAYAAQLRAAVAQEAA